MNGSQYYHNNYDQTYPVIKDLWGIPSQYWGIGFLLTLFGIMFIIVNWDWISTRWSIYTKSREHKKRLRAGKKGKIKSFIIEVEGKEMSQPKFKRLTEDVNSIIKGKLIKEIGTTGMALDANNVIGITNLPAAASHFFVIWYREV